ncbi:SIMPL domain-containing protein [Nocardioides jejuensis]|uniref:SIMPL domain-containing protein n=1 Tax=Nocardioides jejuensis TaxID=2502782 RepID=A0A4R1CJA0_9ACTN|nr:SIMPL domain-containing protein [Nocardioides jejuensis]TCJ30927.1 SIMPL domain-containing protein [Nocardioides jejuensis]
MAQVVFTVSGTHVLMLPPERALLHVSIAHEGSAPDRVYADTAHTHRRISALLADLHDPDNGPVRGWNSGQIRTWSHRPWSQDGRQLPVVHDAAVDVRARFSDFGRLSEVVGAINGWSGVSIDQIEWKVTEATRSASLRDARAAAVHDAQVKAAEYAAALGLAAVRPIEIADAGMLQGVAVRDLGMRAMHAEVAADGPSVEFRPDDIEISVGVDARFVAD